MNMIIGSVHWASFEYVWLGPVVLLAIGILFYRYYVTLNVVELLTRSRTSILLHNFSLVRTRLKILLMGVGLFFLYTALLRPQWYQQNKMVAQEGRDLFIALDISRSMLVADCEPNRLACAKKKIQGLIHLLPGTRVGLILFSGSAFVQCPLTSDYGAFNLFLNSVDVETISSGTTALDIAIQKVIDTFESMPTKKNKLLVLFTDGEDFSHNLTAVKNRARSMGLSIFTVGMGTVTGGPIPLYDVQGKIIGHQKDTQDKVVISHLNESVLHTIAEDVGGTYIPLTENENDIQSIAQFITAFEKEKYEDKEISQMQEQYPYFLFGSFICFILEWLL